MQKDLEEMARVLAFEAFFERRRIPWRAQEEAMAALPQAPGPYFEKAKALWTAGARLAMPGSPAWPAGFSLMKDPPHWVWYRGVPPASFDDLCPVAVVGSRHPVPYAEEALRLVCAQLVSQGQPVISGLAIGTDTLAHEAALSFGGLTAAVLPCGIESIYPKRNRGLSERILGREGFLMTEFPPGMGIRKMNFHSRNRLVSALSRAVVVIQGGEKSGTLITAHTAAEQGREVYVVPARLGDRGFEGSLSLIADGARILDSPARLAELLF